MRAIITEYTGSGYRATTGERRPLTVEVDHSLNSEQNHANAARLLAEKMGSAFEGKWAGGYLGNGKMAWVANDEHSPSFRTASV